MAKRNKIIYWIATLWLSLGMLSTGIVQILKRNEEITMMKHLGYPEYLLMILGIWKILGVIAVLSPKFPLLKEWAYAGFFFTMWGAIISHLILKDSFGDIAPSLLLLVLTIISWCFRPANRKLTHSTTPMNP